MVKRQLKYVALLCCLLVFLTGCSKKWIVLGAAAAAAGAGTYAYIKGELTRNYEAPIDKAWEATVKAVEELKIAIESKQHDAFSGIIKGKMADGKSLEINLKKLGETSTEIGIRIGTFGDSQKSEVIHNKILSNL